MFCKIIQETFLKYSKMHQGHLHNFRISVGYASVSRYAAAAAKSLQSCPTLYNPWDGSPPGSPVLGILQARTLEWVAISFSNAWKWKVKVSDSSRPHRLQPTRLFRPWDFPGKSTGVGCHMAASNYWLWFYKRKLIWGKWSRKL